MAKWISLSFADHSAINKTTIDKETMKLVKYFIASNSAASEFNSFYFRDLFSGLKLKIPCSKTFSDVSLKDVFDKLTDCTTIKLKDAVIICLITDIWSNKQLKDFMGVAVNLINKNFEKSTIVIGLAMMPGCHNAENTKESIESVVNKYDTDKHKVHGIYYILFYIST